MRLLRASLYEKRVFQNAIKMFFVEFFFAETQINWCPIGNLHVIKTAHLLTIIDLMSLKSLFVCRNSDFENGMVLFLFFVVANWALLVHIVVAQVENKTTKKQLLKPFFAGIWVLGVLGSVGSFWAPLCFFGGGFGFLLFCCCCFVVVVVIVLFLFLLLLLFCCCFVVVLLLFVLFCLLFICCW